VLDANAFTVNLCFAGSRSAWKRNQWLAREADIEIAAFIAVQDCRKYGIPIVVIQPPYTAGPGLSDHKYVTQELGIGTHTDVGPNFPWDVFTNYVEKFAGGQVMPSVTPPKTQDDAPSVVPPDLQLGSTGPAVRTLQNRLKTAYAAYAGQIVVDGDFGPMTRGAVMEFQKRSNLEVDGVVGAQTAAALRI
jgi:lysozyme family protein